MTPPRLVNLRHYTGPVVYIGRPGRGVDGPLGNPYRVGQRCARCQHWHAGGKDTLECFSAYLHDRVSRDPEYRRTLLEARDQVRKGVPLACFCAGKNGLDVDQAFICHGQVILRWMDAQP